MDLSFGLKLGLDFISFSLFHFSSLDLAKESMIEEEVTKHDRVT